ncbi:MAG: hypothetical protein U0359_33020 [Byssovorax sp.]
MPATGAPAAPFVLPPPLSPFGEGAPGEARSRSPERARALHAAARKAFDREDYQAAAQAAMGAVARGGRGQLLLARIEARLGDVNGALYWLLRAAIEEGVDPAAARDDEALAPLRNDLRWPAVSAFLDQTSAYWAASGRRTLLFITPDRRTPGRPLPLVVALHADGDEPADFLDPQTYRAWARKLGVAFVGVSATIPLGPRSFRWSHEPADNTAHLARAVEEITRRLRIPGAPVILLGFSEGAQAALVTAALDPERYRGAIALSPSSLGSPIAPIAPHPALAGQRYVVAYASFDSFDAVGTAYIDIDRLRELGAEVDSHTAWFYGTHGLPPDYELQFPKWIDRLVGRAVP